MSCGAYGQNPHPGGYLKSLEVLEYVHL